MQGESLLPLFNNDNSKWRDELYYHYYEYPGIHMVKDITELEQNGIN